MPSPRRDSSCYRRCGRSSIHLGPLQPHNTNFSGTSIPNPDLISTVTAVVEQIPNKHRSLRGSRTVYFYKAGLPVLCRQAFNDLACGNNVLSQFRARSYALQGTQITSVKEPGSLFRSVFIAKCTVCHARTRAHTWDKALAALSQK